MMRADVSRFVQFGLIVYATTLFAPGLGVEPRGVASWWLSESGAALCRCRLVDPTGEALRNE